MQPYNYYNPYVTPYSSYRPVAPQPQMQPTMQQPMPQPVQQVPQTTGQYVTLPIVRVNGLNDVRGYVVDINQTIYFQDGQYLYIKSVDSAGNVKIDAFQTKPIALDQIGKSETEIMTTQFALKSDLELLKKNIGDTMAELNKKIEELKVVDKTL